MPEKLYRRGSPVFRRGIQSREDACPTSGGIPTSGGKLRSAAGLFGLFGTQLQ